MVTAVRFSNGQEALSIDYSGAKYVRSAQSQQFAAPTSGGEVEVVELVHTAVPGLLEKGAELVRGQRFHLFVFDFRQGAALRWIFRDKALLHGEIVRRADHLVDVADGLWC